MTEKDNRFLQLYKTGAVLVLAFLEYYFIEYIFWSIVLGCASYATYVYFGPKTPPTIDPTGKAILITGCDTGFGRELAIRAHKIGFTVFAGCYAVNTEGPRELECTYEERMHVLKMDVTSDDEVNATLKYVRERCRSTGLWAVVNNAGINAAGPVEISSMKYYKDVCEVNLFGTIRVTKAFLPLLRLAKGRIVNVSSVRGLLARGNNSTYCISKYGVEAFSDCLRHEMNRFGVQVSVIEPGHFRGATGILQEHNCLHFLALKHGFDEAGPDVKSAYPPDIVEQIVSSCPGAIASSYKTMDPVIDVMECQLIHKHIKPRYLVGGSNSMVVFVYLKMFLPDSILDYLISFFKV